MFNVHNRYNFNILQKFMEYFHEFQLLGLNSILPTVNTPTRYVFIFFINKMSVTSECH